MVHDNPRAATAVDRGSLSWLLALAALFGLVFIALAFNPHDRADWALENLLVLVFVLVLAVTCRRLPLSRLSYTLIFFFLCLHEIGAHYTYAQVPYDAWSQRLFGVSFNDLVGWQRNNFDRVVHFSYGLLLAYPIRELFFRVADARGFWSYFLPLDVTMSTSMLFELFEWAAAELFGGELGVAYLGTQGDIWDAHKDMALATLGAALAMGLTCAVNSILQRDFAREWQESVRIKHQGPLGEEKLMQMLKDKGGKGD